MNVPSAFKDMAADRWSNGFVNIASELKIIAGYSDGTFRPRKNVSYQEAIKMLAVAAGGTDIKPATQGEWAAPFISYAANKGILNGLSDLKYKDVYKRQHKWRVANTAHFFHEKSRCRCSCDASFLLCDEAADCIVALINLWLFRPFFEPALFCFVCKHLFFLKTHFFSVLQCAFAD